MTEIKCCVDSCSNNKLDEKYWNDQYEAHTTGWDLGEVSPPIKTYMDTITDKNSAILIPGCGNSYEAEYLLAQGFTNITVIDIAPLLVQSLQEKFNKSPNITVVLGDFFDYSGSFDYIIEQTFFCALLPALREKYRDKMSELLNKSGVLAGLFFNRTFEVSPPFGGSKEEYEVLFAEKFTILKMEPCRTSIQPRMNSELWCEMTKK